jgi:hypothetical protein
MTGRLAATVVVAIAFGACTFGSSDPTTTAAAFEEAPPPPEPSTTIVPVSTVLASGSNEALKAELLDMMAADQLERTGGGLPAGSPLPPSQDYVRSLRLREIIDEYGWPTFDLVGKAGSTAAWVIAQHSDYDVDLQEVFLAEITEAVAAGQADVTEMAYLWDRVAVNRIVSNVMEPRSCVATVIRRHPPRSRSRMSSTSSGSKWAWRRSPSTTRSSR